MSGRVLLIDDEQDVRLSIAQALDLAGFEVEQFADAQSALDLVSFGFRGIVVTDIRMPGMDGMTFMNRVAEIDTEIPVILWPLVTAMCSLPCGPCAKAPMIFWKSRSRRRN